MKEGEEEEEEEGLFKGNAVNEEEKWTVNTRTTLNTPLEPQADSDEPE